MGDIITRLDAIKDIQCGMGICLTFQGRYTSYRLILRRRASDHEQVEAVYEDLRFNRIYFIIVTPKQVLSYIKRWYPRKVEDAIVDTTDPTLWERVAA